MNVEKEIIKIKLDNKLKFNMIVNHSTILEDLKKTFEDLKKDFVKMNELILKDYKEFNRRLLALEGTIIRPRPKTNFPPGVKVLRMESLQPHLEYNAGGPEIFTHDLNDPYVTIKKTKVKALFDLLNAEGKLPYHLLMQLREFLREAGIE